MPSFKLIDGEKRNKKYPDTFKIPSEITKAAVEVGDYVKLGLELVDKTGERMWFKVVHRTLDTFTGVLDNHPVVIEDIECGDELLFETKHILATWEN